MPRRKDIMKIIILFIAFSATFLLPVTGKNGTTQKKGNDFTIDLDKLYDSAGKEPNRRGEMIDSLLMIRRSLNEYSKKDSLNIAVLYYLSAIYYEDRQYDKAMKFARKGKKADRDNYNFYYLNGLVYFSLSEKEKGKKAERLSNKALKEYTKALKVYPKTKVGYAKRSRETYPSRVYRNIGNLYLNKAYKENEDALREKYFEETVNCFDKVYESFQLTRSFYFDYTLALANLAKYKQPATADSLYDSAKETLEEATDDLPERYGSYYMWGGCLQTLGHRRQGVEADSLYFESIEKLEKAVKLIPEDDPGKSKKLINCYEALQYAYAKRACLKQGVESKELFDTALDFGKKATELGAEYYNHACVYALKGDCQTALYYLHLSLQKKDVKFKYVENDSDWDACREHSEYLKLKKKYGA